jgi:hypothetical protein
VGKKVRLLRREGSTAPATMMPWNIDDVIDFSRGGATCDEVSDEAIRPAGVIMQKSKSALRKVAK